MPIPGVLGVEWRDQNKSSSYPFVDGSTLTSGDGARIAPDIILDAILYPLGLAGTLYLSQIDVDADAVTFWIGDNKNTKLASGTYDPKNPPEQVAFVDAYGRPAGLFVADGLLLAYFSTFSVGSHVFTPAAATFVAAVVVPMPQTLIRGFQLPDGSIVSGEVWLVGGAGIIIRQDEDGAIRFDAVGDPLFKRRICSAEAVGFSTPRFVQTFGGAVPDELGNIVLTTGENLASDNILRIEANNSEIKISAVGQKLAGVL